MEMATQQQTQSSDPVRHQTHSDPVVPASSVRFEDSDSPGRTHTCLGERDGKKDSQMFISTQITGKKKKENKRIEIRELKKSVL